MLQLHECQNGAPEYMKELQNEQPASAARHPLPRQKCPVYLDLTMSLVVLFRTLSCRMRLPLTISYLEPPRARTSYDSYGYGPTRNLARFVAVRAGLSGTALASRVLAPLPRLLILGSQVSPSSETAREHETKTTATLARTCPLHNPCGSP